MAFRIPRPALPTLAPSQLARAGLSTFFRIADEWELDGPQQMTLLGLTSRTTFFRWKRVAPAALPPDTLERLSHVFGIYKSLQIFLPVPPRPTWIHRPNASAAVRRPSGARSDARRRRGSVSRARVFGR